jgi:hypothetical protein
MGRIEGEIVIARPVDVVFDYAGPGARYVTFRHKIGTCYVYTLSVE